MQFFEKWLRKPKRIQSKIMISLLLTSLVMILYISIASFRLASDKVKDVSLRLSESNTAAAVTALNNSLDDIHELSGQFVNIKALQELALVPALRTISSGEYARYNSDVMQEVVTLQTGSGAYGPKFEFISIQLKNGYSHTSQPDFFLPFSNYDSCICYFEEQDSKIAGTYTSPRWLLCKVDGEGVKGNILVYLRFLYHSVTMEKLGVIVFGISEDWLSETYLPYAKDACLMTKSGILYSASGNAGLIGSEYQQNEELLKEIQKKHTQTAASIAYGGTHGETQIASYQQLAVMQAYLVVPFDLYEGISAKEMQSFLRAVILMGVIGLVVTAALSHLLSQGLSRSVLELTEFTKKVEHGESDLRYETRGQDEIAYLGRQINDMLDQLQTVADQREAGLRANQELELQLNQIQINPHLLYNTLDSVLWGLQQGRVADATSLIASLSEFFKISLSKGRMRIPLSSELMLIQHYLTIQRLARQKQIRLEIDIEEELQNAEIIKLTLQPLVENAVVHGFSGYRDDGTIFICARKIGTDVKIRLMDNGIGMLPEEVDELNRILQMPSLPATFHHFGLFNINRRIVQAFGKNYGLDIESSVGESTTIQMTIPFTPSSVQEDSYV